MSGQNSFTKLLWHCNGVDGATSDTATTGQTVSFIGNAQLDTAQTKFGTSSVLFDGAGDRSTIPASADWNFGVGNFTIDFWVRFNSTSGTQEFISQYIPPNFQDQWLIEISAGKLIIFSNVSNNVTAYYTMTNTWSVNTGQWYHLAFVRSGSSIYIFIDGISQALTAITAVGTSTFPNVATGTLNIGYKETGYVNGWMDEIRIQKGEAYWTSNFTPPSSEYNNLTTNIKTITGLAYANVKTINGLAIASVKTRNGLA